MRKHGPRAFQWLSLWAPVPLFQCPFTPRGVGAVPCLGQTKVMGSMIEPVLNAFQIILHCLESHSVVDNIQRHVAFQILARPSQPFFSQRLSAKTLIACSSTHGYGDADKNLDWLCREAQAFTILNGTERAEGNLDSFFVVPANV